MASRLLVSCVLGVMVPASAVTAANVPNRVTRGDVYGYEDMKLRNASPNLYLMAEGDYDGDGVRDVAVFVKTADGKADAVVVSGKTKQIYRLERGIDLKVAMPRMGVRTVKPGTYQTACGKGSGDERAPCEPSVTARHDAVEVFTFEVGATLYVWRGKGFRGSVTSD